MSDSKADPVTEGYKKELFTTGNILDQSFLAVKSKKNMSLYEN